MVHIDALVRNSLNFILAKVPGSAIDQLTTAARNMTRAAERWGAPTAMSLAMI
jgi:hypothetical protein